MIFLTNIYFIFQMTKWEKTRLKTNSILDRKLKYTLELIQGLGQVWPKWLPIASSIKPNQIKAMQ